MAINQYSDDSYITAFSKYYQQLTTTLPAEAMYTTFVEKGLLGNDLILNDKFLTATTDKDRMTLLLTSISPLQIDSVNEFRKLLQAMNDFIQGNNDPVLKKLMDDIYKDLDFRSNSSSPSDSMGSYIVSRPTVLSKGWHFNIYYTPIFILDQSG